jgi:hypothetical protein
MTEYREGDDSINESESIEAPPTPMEPEEDAKVSPISTPVGNKEEARKPITAVLLIQFENGVVEAITDLPNMETNHKASVREARNMCQSVVADLNNMIQSKLVSNELQMAAAQRQLANQVGDIRSRLKV